MDFPACPSRRDGLSFGNFSVECLSSSTSFVLGFLRTVNGVGVVGFACVFVVGSVQHLQDGSDIFERSGKGEIDKIEHLQPTIWWVLMSGK